jgi:CubicO group peptidase (beta-lactamase class C family)
VLACLSCAEEQARTPAVRLCSAKHSAKVAAAALLRYDALMTRRQAAFLILSLTILLALLSGCSPVQRPLDRQLRAIVEDPGAPLASLAVVVVAGDTVIDESYWGRRTIDAADPQRSRPVTPATKFRVASLSKVATAIGAMQLVEEGKLDLDADVGQYLGFTLRNPAYPDRPITTRMLLSHTSSLRDAGFYNLPFPYTLRDLFVPGSAYYSNGAHFGGPQEGADRGPGAFFTYANLNYGVLATVMEAASQERFDLYMARHIFAPLSIDAGFATADLSDAGVRELAALYTKQDAQGIWDPQGRWYSQVDDLHGVRPRPRPPVGGNESPTAAMHKKAGSKAEHSAVQPYVIGTNATIFAPHSGLRISARDLAKLLLLLLDHGRYGGRQLLKPSTVDGMLHEHWHFDPQLWNGDSFHGRYRGWGLGLQHITGAADDLGGDRLAAGSEEQFWGHRGEAYGLLGGMWFDPQREVGFVFLAGGVGDDPGVQHGTYSSAYSWEEKIQTAIIDEIDRVTN